MCLTCILLACSNHCSISLQTLLTLKREDIDRTLLNHWLTGGRWLPHHITRNDVVNQVKHCQTIAVPRPDLASSKLGLEIVGIQTPTAAVIQLGTRAAIRWVKERLQVNAASRSARCGTAAPGREAQDLANVV